MRIFSWVSSFTKLRCKVTSVEFYLCILQKNFDFFGHFLDHLLMSHTGITLQGVKFIFLNSPSFCKNQYLKDNFQSHSVAS